MRDYYKTLGLPLNATPEAIKAAYHELARAHHPDVADRDSHSDQLMRDINQAYSVLGDHKLRRAYDMGRRHTAKDRDRRKHRVTFVGVVATGITACLGLALVYAMDLGKIFDEQLRTAPSRSDIASRSMPKAATNNGSKSAPGHEEQPAHQVAEWKLAAKDLPQAVTPRSAPPTIEQEAPGPESETSITKPPSAQLPDTNVTAGGSSAENAQAQVEDQTNRPKSRDIASLDRKGHTITGGPPARSGEKAKSLVQETMPPDAALHSVKPAKRQRKRPRIGQSWSQSWKLIAKRWSPRFSVRHLRVYLDKDCASCRWVKFAALRHDVRIHEARIHYSDGTSRKLKVAGTIEDGHETMPQKLGVRFANFSFISVTHQSPFNLKSGGWIAVYGIESLGADKTHQMVSRRD
ncbi:MAG: DnaJ domain-containing protein [Pseudomonadota bacterium]